MKSDYNEKREQRISRYAAMSFSLDAQSAQAYKRSYEMVDGIPFGQPILVGHHSERGHRSLLNRSWNMMGKSVELGQKARHYAHKAEAAENNSAISSDDPEAITKLKQRIAGLEKNHETMKAANKIIKNAKMTTEQKVLEFEKIGLSASHLSKLSQPDFCGRIGFASFSLTNNSANIARLKDRLKHLEALSSKSNKEYTIGDAKIVENYDENRLQIFFPGKPSDDIRSKLKSYGFRWAPSTGAWQQYINNRSIYSAKSILTSQS